MDNRWAMTTSSPDNPDHNNDQRLQLLLFVDQRTTASDLMNQIVSKLNEFKEQEEFLLEIVDVHDQPYLAEHFKLVVTPALIKTFPPPRHVIGGSNLLEQLEQSWPKWKMSLDTWLMEQDSAPQADSYNGLAKSVELLQLSDRLFRLEKENEALKDQLAFKDRMITILAHDLRNPLTAAAIAVETLKGQWSLAQQPKKKLQPELLLRLINQAQTQIQNIDRMITNLLEASRGRSEDLRIQPKQLLLQSLCIEVLEDIGPSLKQKSLELSSDIPTDVPAVHADADQIRQVLMNLFDNAMKYTQVGGKIKLTILHRTTQKVQVCICDDGLGIPLEKQATIFEDSVRLARDENKEGYGIGLALCRRIVRAHYGQIWVDSKPNEGSCFNFTLPVFR